MSENNNNRAPVREIRRDYHLLFARLGRYADEIADEGLGDELKQADMLLCRVINAIGGREEAERMLRAIIYGVRWEEGEHSRMPVCMEGKVVVTDDATGLEITRRFDDGIFIKGGMLWIGTMNQPGYFCAMFDVIDVVDDRRDWE